MNRIDIILREAKNKILTREDLDSLANKYRFDKFKLRKLLLNGGYLLTIFRGVYYLKSYEEKNKGVILMEIDKEKLKNFLTSIKDKTNITALELK